MIMVHGLIDQQNEQVKAGEPLVQPQVKKKKATNTKPKKKPKKKPAAKSPPPPPRPQQIYASTPVEPDSSDPNIARENANLATNFTNGEGIVRTNRLKTETIIGDYPTHFRFSDGQIFAMHIIGDNTGDVLGNVFVPPGFEVIFVGG